ncbi:MAG: hypothetical protein P1U63_00150 [Coxiellaceae bacterium]|nr:hypothetical protein [Coxiellaceae bacterium]
MPKLIKLPSAYSEAELTALLSGDELFTNNLIAIEKCLKAIVTKDHQMMEVDRFKVVVEAIAKALPSMNWPKIEDEKKYRQVLIGNVFLHLYTLFSSDKAKSLPEIFHGELNSALVVLFGHFLEIYNTYESEQDARLLDALLCLAADYSLDVITTVDVKKLLPLITACSPHISAERNEHIFTLVAHQFKAAASREQYAASTLIATHGVLSSPASLLPDEDWRSYDAAADEPPVLGDGKLGASS